MPEFDNTPVPPRSDNPEYLLRHIAAMVDCRGCFPNGYMESNGDGGTIIHSRTGFCSRHRDPILLALGYVNGWTHQGGMPQRMTIA